MTGSAKTIGDFVELQRGTTYKSRLLGLPGPILLGLSTIQRHGGFRRDSIQTYGGESPDKLLVRPGELYVSLKDVTQSADLLGAVARLPVDQPVGRLTQDTVKLVPKDGDAPTDFIYWLLRTPDYREYCFERATGTTNLGLDRQDFLSFPVPSPSREQLGLVRLLDTLDDKIELNRRMNRTLEALAQKLFKSWFVDFDPVLAKSQNRKPFGLADEIAALFPDAFEDSELGPIPKGWNVASLDTLAEFRNGLAMQKFPPGLGESLPVLKIAELRAGSTSGADQASADLDPRFVVSDGDLIFSWSGSLMVDVWAGGRAALNQHLFKVVPTDVPQWFCHFWLLEHLEDFQGIAADKATTMGHIRRHHLSDAEIVRPDEKILARADAVIEPLCERVLQNKLQARKLATLRDLLLPKLLSGEIRVPMADPEAEPVFKEAIT